MRQFMPRGIYRQYIYTDQSRDVVNVINVTDRNFRVDGIARLNEDMLRTIAESLD